MPAPGGRERWEFMLQPGETREQMEDAERIGQLLERWIEPSQLNIERKAVYRFHARCCERFQNGRVFLIGDAAHITALRRPGPGSRPARRRQPGLETGLGAAGPCRTGDPRQLRQRTPAACPGDDRPGQVHGPPDHATQRLAGTVRAWPDARAQPDPPARRHFEELDIKPRSIFKRGLFMRQPWRGRVQRGGLLPQGLVRTVDGSIRLSDDVLGIT